MSVSQVKYWLEGSTENHANGTDPEGATYLSYEVFLGLSVLGGFLGLDHFYLRSPLTGIAKFFVNVFCFGLWWIYDALQTVFNADVVKVYGLGIPGWGPMGIGAGVLSKDRPDKKHLRFLLYSVALLFGGVIGLDSFLLGDRQTGIIRLLSFMSVLFMPLAVLWWAYEVFQYATNLEDVINRNNEFFGAPYRSTSDRLRSRFPFLSFLFSPLDSIRSLLNNFLGPALVEPITKTADSAIHAAQSAINTVQSTVQLGQNALSKGANIADQVSKTMDTLSQASSFMPGASLYATAASLPSSQSGGAQTGEQNLNKTGFALLASLLGIVAIGFSRLRNVPRNDTPPEPGVL